MSAWYSLAPPRPAPVPFIVLAHPRSGSNLLTFSLDRHRRVQVLGEILHDNSTIARATLPPRLQPLRDMADATVLIDAVLSPPRPRRYVRACGFKVFYEHARGTERMREVWGSLIARPDLRVIHLGRRNLLDALVSMETAFRSDEWFRFAGTRTAPRPVEPFRLSVSKCEVYFNQTIASRMWAEQAFAVHPMLTLEYERDLRDNFTPTIERVFDFLGVRPVSIAAPLVRQSVSSPSAQITNYDELREYFKYTLFGEHFDEPK